MSAVVSATATDVVVRMCLFGVQGVLPHNPLVTHDAVHVC
jgi:hypothetical protein